MGVVDNARDIVGQPAEIRRENNYVNDDARLHYGNDDNDDVADDDDDDDDRKSGETFLSDYRQHSIVSSAGNSVDEALLRREIQIQQQQQLLLHGRSQSQLPQRVNSASSLRMIPSSNASMVDDVLVTSGLPAGVSLPATSIPPIGRLHSSSSTCSSSATGTAAVSLPHSVVDVSLSYPLPPQPPPPLPPSSQHPQHLSNSSSCSSSPAVVAGDNHQFNYF